MHSTRQIRPPAHVGHRCTRPGTGAAPHHTAPAELEPLRTARKIHLDTLNRLAAGLKVSVYQLMITAQSPWTVHHGGSGSRRAVINRLSDHSPYDISPLFK